MEGGFWSECCEVVTRKIEELDFAAIINLKNKGIWRISLRLVPPRKSFDLIQSVQTMDLGDVITIEIKVSQVGQIGDINAREAIARNIEGLE